VRKERKGPVLDATPRNIQWTKHPKDETSKGRNIQKGKMRRNIQKTKHPKVENWTKHPKEKKFRNIQWTKHPNAQNVPKHPKINLTIKIDVKLVK
jgi:hypothetical protein